MMGRSASLELCSCFEVEADVGYDAIFVDKLQRIAAELPAECSFA